MIPITTRCPYCGAPGQITVSPRQGRIFGKKTQCEDCGLVYRVEISIKNKPIHTLDPLWRKIYKQCYWAARALLTRKETTP